MDTLLEELKNSSGICIVSTQALEMILQDNANLHKATQELNERVVKSAEQLNLFLESNAAEQTAARKDLNDRLDLLIEKISSTVLFPLHKMRTILKQYQGNGKRQSRNSPATRK